MVLRLDAVDVGLREREIAVLSEVTAALVVPGLPLPRVERRAARGPTGAQSVATTAPPSAVTADGPPRVRGSGAEPFAVTVEKARESPVHVGDARRVQVGVAVAHPPGRGRRRWPTLAPPVTDLQVPVGPPGPGEPPTPAAASSGPCRQGDGGRARRVTREL